MGLMQRVKGKRFERRIAALIRPYWPEAIVRRSSQAERAYQSDVFIEGGPAVLSRLWIEAQDARQPDPKRKIEQADRDINATGSWPWVSCRLPVVVWHRFGERETNCSTWLWVIDAVRNPNHTGDYGPFVTMAFWQFLTLVKEQHQ